MPEPGESWCRGFSAGVFDAGGSRSRGIHRSRPGDQKLISWTEGCMTRPSSSHHEPPRNGVHRYAFSGGSSRGCASSTSPTRRSCASALAGAVPKTSNAAAERGAARLQAPSRPTTSRPDRDFHRGRRRRRQPCSSDVQISRLRAGARTSSGRSLAGCGMRQEAKAVDRAGRQAGEEEEGRHAPGTNTDRSPVGRGARRCRDTQAMRIAQPCSR